VSRILAHDCGLTWVCDEPLARTSHALADAGRVWLVDPVADEEALERAQGLGGIAGVVQLLDRHGRDGAALAARFAVPHTDVGETVADAPFETVRVLDIPGWHESALWWPARRALVVAEVVGTSPHVALGRDAGIHPMLRLRPPGALRPFQPEHLLVGHGPPLHGPDAAAALHGAYARSRRDLPRMVLAVPALLGAARGRWG
jgi:hypothetical protein